VASAPVEEDNGDTIVIRDDLEDLSGNNKQKEEDKTSLVLRDGS
jgi:hypothetical protein